MPGIVAVLASGLMGTTSGSAVANTVSIGSITIPMMKKAGFSPRFAAAVETASSTSGSRSMATGFTSWKLAKGLYIMPLLFAYTGLISSTWTDRIVLSLFALVGLFAFTLAFTGYLFGTFNVLSRIFLFLCAIAIFWPGVLWLNCVGVCVLFGVGIINKKRAIAAV